MLEVNINYINLKDGMSSKPLLRNIRFGLEEGNIYTVLGKNGSGKTTLINSLTKLLDNNVYDINGSVNYYGSNIYEMNINDLLNLRKKNIRYVFQDSVNSFDPLKKFEYYFKNLNIDLNELEVLLEYFLLPNLEKLSAMYPYEVSGGMAQRVSACIAISNKPKLLILDEPTSAIDITISNLLCKKLREFATGHKAMILIITQDLDFAENVSDYIAYLKEGSLSNFSPVSENKINKRI